MDPRTLCVTWDVIGLFTNIFHKEGLGAMERALNRRANQKVPSLISKKFHDSYWKQEVGAAMGGRPIPGYANIRMAQFYEEIIRMSKSYSLDRKDAIP